MIVSCYAPDPAKAMTVMPFILIIQLVFSGVLFELSGLMDKVADLTISKWGMAATGTIGDLNSESLPSSITQAYPDFPFPAREADALFDHTRRHLGNVWLILIAFIAAYYIISVIALRLTTRKLHN